MHPILVVRHAKQEGGHSDLAPLTEAGVSQAKALREKIVQDFFQNKNKKEILGLCSFTSRTYHTALHAVGFYEQCGTPIELRGIHFYPGGESKDVLDRFEEGLKELIQTSLDPSSSYKTVSFVVIVAHSDTLYEIVSRLAKELSLPFETSKREDFEYCEGFLLSDGKVEEWPSQK